MSKPLAESLLARLADKDRAAAIYGDLVELSATRGRLWFWTVYARTLISLGWRTPVAFVVAIVSMRVMFKAVIPWIFHSFWLTHRNRQWANPGLFGEENRHFSMILWNVSLVIAEPNDAAFLRTVPACPARL
jgi:hypothetical protein